MNKRREETITDELVSVLAEWSEDTEGEMEERRVYLVDETHLLIDDVTYEVVENFRDGFNVDALNHRYNDIFARYDYIVGDWGHDKLRLKGFFKHSNRLATPEKDILFLQEYLYEYCNFGCQYFVIERDPKAKFTPKEDALVPKRQKPSKNNRRQQRRQEKEDRPKKDRMESMKKETVSEAKAAYIESQKQHRSQRVERKKFEKRMPSEEATFEKIPQKSTHKKQRFTAKQEKFQQWNESDFGLKEMTQKESLHLDPKPMPVPKTNRQGRSFSIKEVEQTKNAKPKTTKTTKTNHHKRFDIREKQPKRGK